jgi:hypothetical protein
MKKVIKLEGRVKFSGSGAFNCDGEFAGDTANVYKWTKILIKTWSTVRKCLLVMVSNTRSAPRQSIRLFLAVAHSISAQNSEKCI